MGCSMFNWKRFIVGSLIVSSLPGIYVSYRLIDRNANSITGKIIEKHENIEGTALDAYLTGYTLVTERDGDPKIHGDTTLIVLPGKDHYNEQATGLVGKVWAEQAKQAIDYEERDGALLEDSLKQGRVVRLEIGKDNMYRATHTITPDKISLMPL
jgi:hypothetical protein